MAKTFFLFVLICFPAALWTQTWIERSLEPVTDTVDAMKRLDALNRIFYAYVYSYPDSALPYAQQSILLARKMKSDFALSQAYGLYSTYASQTGNYPIALQYAFEALKHAEQTGNFILIGSSTIRLTDVYLTQGDIKRAVLYGEKAKAVFDAHFTMPNTAPTEYHDTLTPYSNTLYKLTEAYVMNGQLDSALKYIQQVEFASSWWPVPWPTEPYTYGNIYYKLGDYSKAIRYYHQGIQSAISHDIKKDLIDIYNALAALYYDLHQEDSSIHYAHKVIETSRSAKYPIGQMKAIEILAGSYKAQNNIDSMAKYFELALALKDSFFNQDKLAQFQTLAFNEQVRQQEIQEEQQQRWYQYRLYTLGGGLFALAILALLLFRNSRQKQRAKSEIEKAYGKLKSTQAQLIQAEKMASLGELTAGIAHEIQNPLNFVNNFAEINQELLQEIQDELIGEKNGKEKRRQEEGSPEASGEKWISVKPEILESIQENQEKILHHGKRADAIVKSMLEHSRHATGGNSQKVPVDLNALCGEYLRLAYHGLRGKDKNFNSGYKLNLDPALPEVKAIPQEIGRVLLNLINNAFYSVQQRSKTGKTDYQPMVTVSTKILDQGVEIRVKDNGEGISESIREKIFQPFFTTKPTGQGTGLGLSLSYDIIKAHGGEIQVESREQEGVEFIIRLPKD